MKTVEIPLDEIRPAKEPVRQMRDEDKIEELTQSIAEKGVLQPIKVRPVNNDGTTQYEIVFGARRWEVARIVGLDTIPAIVQEMNLNQAKIEGVIENLQRDDMSDVDLSRVLNSLKDKNGKPLSDREVARLLGKSQSRISTIRSLTRENNNIAEVFVNEITSDRLSGHLGKNSQIKTLPKDLATKAQFIDRHIKDKEIQQEMASKVIQENLSQQKTWRISQMIADAEAPEMKQAILESSYEDIIASPNYVKAKANVKRKQKKQKTRKQKEMEREVKLYLDAIQTFNAVLEDAILAAEYGKFSPEAARFTLRKHTTFQDFLNQFGTNR